MVLGTRNGIKNEKGEVLPFIDSSLKHKKSNKLKMDELRKMEMNLTVMGTNMAKGRCLS